MDASRQQTLSVCLTVCHPELRYHRPTEARGSQANYLHMIDLGLAKKYRDSEQQHIPERSAHFVGTPAYASVNAHAGLELYRRASIVE